MVIEISMHNSGLALGLIFAQFGGELHMALVAALWGAGGVAMAAWLRGGRGLQYDLGFGVLVVAGVFAGEILAGNGPSLSVLFTLTNLLEIVLAVVLTRRLVTGLHVDSVEGLARLRAVSESVDLLPPSSPPCWWWAASPLPLRGPRAGSNSPSRMGP